MTDPATPPPPLLPQLVINPSAIRAVAISLTTALGLVLSTLVTLAAFVKNRDLAGWIVWIKSEDFVSFLGALSLLASFAVVVWRALSRKWREVYLAKHVDDAVAVVKVPTPAPSVEAIVPPSSV